MKTKMKQLRVDKGWTQQETAYHLGVSIDAVKSIESGRSLPSLRTAIKMKRVFGCKHIDDLFDEAI